jgi:uncharacterized protein (DUF433 family)
MAFSKQLDAMSSVIRAFSAVHVCRLTGLSQRQLSYWDGTEFFSPYYASENRRSPYSRVYSFDDLVGLRVIAILRKDHQIALQTLRRTAEELSRYHSRPWSGLTLYVAGKKIHFKDPQSGKIRKVGSPQIVFPLSVDRISDDMKAKADELRNRSKDQIGRVERNRNTVHNAWVIAGTRIPTKTVWRYYEAGYDSAAIRRDYPMLTDADVKKAISHERALKRKAA